MLFFFIARTIAGQEQRGTLEAPSLEHAREELRKKNLLVDTVRLHHSMVEKKSGPLWTDTEPVKKQEATTLSHAHSYVPLTETLRLFAGWLLAWYGLVYLLGALKLENRLPFEVPFVEGLFLSPLILRLAFGMYLFLLLTTIHKALGRGTGKGIALTLAGVLAFAFFHVNVG